MCRKERTYLVYGESESSDKIAFFAEVVTERKGDGKTFPKKGDMLTMHYLGTLSNGNKFDSSYDRGSPFKFQIGVGQVLVVSPCLAFWLERSFNPFDLVTSFPRLQRHFLTIPPVIEHAGNQGMGRGRDADEPWRKGGPLPLACPSDSETCTLNR